MELPKMIFGTSALGNLYSIMPDELKCTIVGEYINVEKGNNKSFFDSAGKYGAGLALESLGNCLKQLNVSNDEVVISNKLGWLRAALTTPEPTFGPGVWKGLKYDAVQKISYDGILECYEQGNELLNGYHTDYVSVHDPDEYLSAASGKSDEDRRYQDILGAYQALKDLQQQGKVEAIGVGAKDWKSIARIDQDVKLDWVMIANSMTVHQHPKELLSFMKKLKEQGTVIINSAVFNAGFLTGGDYYNYKLIDPETESGRQLINWRERFYQVCTTFDVSPAAACIQFGLAGPGVKAIAVSTTNPDRVAYNAALINADVPQEFWHELHAQELISEEGLEMISGKH